MPPASSTDSLAVARFADLPDDGGLCVNVDGRQIALFRVGDEVFAIDNVCPHQGGPLADGCLDGAFVTCPMHAWTFDVRTGAVVSGGSIPVRAYDAVVDGGEIMVALPFD